MHAKCCPCTNKKHLAATNWLQQKDLIGRLNFTDWRFFCIFLFQLFSMASFLNRHVKYILEMYMFFYHWVQTQHPKTEGWFITWEHVMEHWSTSITLLFIILKRGKKIIKKTHTTSGSVCHFFFLLTSFQDDKDLVHEFVVAEGLTCLIKVGAEADQNYQNYILRGACTYKLTAFFFPFFFFSSSTLSHTSIYSGKAKRGGYSSALSHASFRKPIQDHMCLHTPCKLMIPPDDPLALCTLAAYVNTLKCVPQIMRKGGQVEQLINLSAPRRWGEWAFLSGGWWREGALCWGIPEGWWLHKTACKVSAV